MSTTSDAFLDLQAALAGEYSLVRELGRGGMGIVYLARDVQLDRHVAIKVLPAHLAERAEARERFLREARTAAGLSHPHIVPIHRVGETGGFVFFVMSYVAGQTLGERLRTTGPLPAAEAMRIMREVAWALAHAHARGVVHRDVKPDNILLEEGTGRAMVTDFGIAWRGDVAGDTDPGRIMGTAHFMSPEQAANGPVDGRSDLYSLGVVGFLASSGRLPFEAPSLTALLVRQVSEAAPALALLAPGSPVALGRAIDRCLERDPSRRFADGGALAEALAPVADSHRSLSAPLRHWLATRNPAQWAYTAWMGGASLVFVAETSMILFSDARIAPTEPIKTLAEGLAPLVPIVWFHVSGARRLFRSGHTLRDLRDALGIAALERREQQALEGRERITLAQQLLRGLTYLSAAVTTAICVGTERLLIRGLLFSPRDASTFVFGSIVVSGLLLVAMNMAEVPILPRPVRRFFGVGVRERLWNSRLGAWLAQRLGAPTESRAVGAGMFRATEAALGVAASDLFAALPKAYRERLADLPGTVARLEAQAAAARAEVEAVGVLSQGAGSGASPLDDRRAAASAQLASSVAALEGIRLDLLRLHAGASDLAPLTTLLDAARDAGAEMGRIARAQEEAEGGARRARARREATPV